MLDIDDEFKGMMIAVPCYGGTLRMETCASLSELRHMLSWVRAPSRQYHHDMCDIVEVRNSILTKFYDDLPELDHLLMVDADMYFQASLVFQMIKLKKPLVGTIYHRRQVGADLGPLVIGEPLPEGNSELVDGFQRWNYVGGGLLLIKRRVITEMLQKMPEISDFIDPGALKVVGISRMIRAFDKMHDSRGRPLSEDFSFCERWHRCGGEVWANVQAPVGHIGSFNYGFSNYGGDIPELLGLRPEAPAAAEAA